MDQFQLCNERSSFYILHTSILFQLGQPTVDASTEVYNDDINVVKSQTVEYFVEVEIPEGEQDLFKLEVLTAFNTTARMKLCLVELHYKGK